MRTRVLLALCLPAGILALAGAVDPTAGRRAAMVREIEAGVAATSREIGRKALDRRVMEAMGRVPRHEFVPKDERTSAYENRPLPIGYGQTISQPYIVALMTDLLEVKPGAVALEIGTGSGYQAAILSQLAAAVYTIEIIPELGRSAAERLRRLGYANVTVRIGDGYHGRPDRGPFDAIVVTAAADHVPPPLVKQLKPGGKMVIPIGGPFFTQYLTLVEKDARGKIRTRQLLPVRFVPLTGRH